MSKLMKDALFGPASCGDFPSSKLIPGHLYRITYRDHRPYPNLYRFEGRSKPVHCQLHGEYIGEEYEFTKRRNSDVRPWSGNHWFRLNGLSFEDFGPPPPRDLSQGGQP